MKLNKTIKIQNQDLLSRLVEIRLQTGLTQEPFYRKYLEPLNIKDFKSDSGIQGFMSDLENGYIWIPPEVLQVYSQIGKCSIDSIIAGKDFTPDETPQKLTARDICKMLMMIDRAVPVQYAMKARNLTKSEQEQWQEAESRFDGGTRTQANQVWFSIPAKTIELELLADQNEPASSCHIADTNILYAINDFIVRYRRLSQIDMLEDDEKEVLINRWLQAVPDQSIQDYEWGYYSE